MLAPGLAGGAGRNQLLIKSVVQVKVKAEPQKSSLHHEGQNERCQDDVELDAWEVEAHTSPLNLDRSAHPRTQTEAKDVA